MASKPPPVVSLQSARIGHPPHTVLDEVDAEVHTGENVLMVGPNGAGKSTLLATLAGLLPLLSGQVRVLGIDPMAERRRLHATTGHLGHKSGFYPELTGRENLNLHAGLRGLGRGEVDEQLAQAGLTQAADRLFSHYSHGMGRRLGLAKALLGRPRLLLLDEPDSGLDRAAHARLRENLSRDEKRTVLMVTHTPRAHLDWAHRAWVLGQRRLVEVRAQDATEGIPRAMLEQAIEEVEA